ncbi:MAG TPA: hypothetical protein VGJ45_11770, partial [Pseudonocardiaceae bacterium]
MDSAAGSGERCEVRAGSASSDLRRPVLIRPPRPKRSKPVGVSVVRWGVAASAAGARGSGLLGATGMGSTGMGSAGLGAASVGSAGFDWVGLGCAGLNCAESGWAGLNCAESGWAGLAAAGSSSQRPVSDSSSAGSQTGVQRWVGSWLAACRRRAVSAASAADSGDSKPDQVACGSGVRTGSGASTGRVPRARRPVGCSAAG